MDDDARICLIICSSIVVFFVAFFVGITIWVIVGNDAHNERTEIKAKACMKAPSAQVANCLKLNA